MFLSPTAWVKQTYDSITARIVSKSSACSCLAINAPKDLFQFAHVQLDDRRWGLDHGGRRRQGAKRGMPFGTNSCARKVSRARGGTITRRRRKREEQLGAIRSATTRERASTLRNDRPPCRRRLSGFGITGREENVQLMGGQRLRRRAGRLRPPPELPTGEALVA